MKFNNNKIQITILICSFFIVLVNYLLLPNYNYYIFLLHSPFI